MVKKITKDVTIKDNGIIVCLFYFLFHQILCHVSIFQIIRDAATIIWRVKRKNYYKKSNEDFIVPWNKEKPFVFRPIFPEIWLLLNLLLGLLSIIFWNKINCNLIKRILTIYAFLRIFEIFVYQVNVMFFDPLKNKGQGYYINSAVRTVIMLILNLVEYILFFTIIYLQFGEAQTVSSAIGNSFNIITGLTSPTEIKQSSWITIGYIEAIIGIFMNIICIARFMSLLPMIETRDGK